MSAPPFTIKWTQTALEMVEAISDRRIRGQILARVDELATAPEALGKPLIGELMGYRAIRAVGQRYRIIYRVERRVEGDRRDVYELARRLLRQRLLGR